MVRLLPPVYVLLLGARLVHGFLPILGMGSRTHYNITTTAVLQAVLKVFQEIPSPQGNIVPAGAFRTDGSDLTAERLFAMYYGEPVSVQRFTLAILEMGSANGMVDVLYMLDSKRHFDSETFLEGKELLLRGKASVVQGILEGHHFSARISMGAALHTLQDFYSHSNWLELGYETPNSNLIKPEQPIGNIAEKGYPTCKGCADPESCRNNILPDVLSQKIITTGYFSLNPFSKPRGKCSHGGWFDWTEPGIGGINKDSLTSPHGHIHLQAAAVATQASLELFLDIRDAVGDRAFLQFLCVDPPTGITFVIDTTGSMRDSIEAAKQRTIHIVQSTRRSRFQPSSYTLVPFNNPGYGPVFQTSNPDMFIGRLQDLQADGGGDTPDMSLSALQLALTHSLPLSHIHVFTDAPAKDSHLAPAVRALIERTKCKVYFLMTRRRRGAEDEPGIALYRGLARDSGGLAVKVTTGQISELTRIVEGSTTGEMVTTLQRDGNTDHLTNVFPFHVDAALGNVTIFLSGSPANFRIASPGGIQQAHSNPSGELAMIEHLGDLFIITLKSPVELGEWNLTVQSETPYTVKVTGQSLVEFLYDFVEYHGGPHPGLVTVSGRPLAGEPATLMVTVMGLQNHPSHHPRQVSLLDRWGQTLREATLEPSSETGIFLSEFGSFPSQGFLVLLSGTEESGRTFRRQSPSFISVTRSRLAVKFEPSFKAGEAVTILFNVTNGQAGSEYVVRLTDDQNVTRGNIVRLYIGSNQSAEGNITTETPPGIEPGTLVTVTVEAVSETDFTYAVLRLMVEDRIEDTEPPTCRTTSVRGRCPSVRDGDCAALTWSLDAEIAEGGSDWPTVRVPHGNGSLSSERQREGALYVTRVRYNSTCCYPSVTLLGVDSSGNVGSCSVEARSRAAPSAYSNMAAVLSLSLAGALLR